MRKKIAFLLAALLLPPAFLFACSSGGGQPEPPAPEPPVSQSPAPESGAFTITFDYVKQTGTASNQFAVWIEDMDGNLVRTLYATGFTANGGYKNRPDSIPLWVEKSGLAAMTKADVDTVTGATPRQGALSYEWDLTDKNGAVVPSGEYKFFVEGSLRWKNRVVYTGVVDIGGGAATVNGEAEYSYASSGGQPALSGDSPENAMISGVTAEWKPAAY